ncbi:uncharacterized protein LOC127788213 [Diospyros lotus]|uniref:uncharacterized protein LOC127788213 n=1 Tax=Diospyros lotus TaxID=55363 RepID=UPI00225208F6|nr:uncharacterized protein LOC127788213 [Diospyros lotus]
MGNYTEGLFHNRYSNVSDLAKQIISYGRFMKEYVETTLGLRLLVKRLCDRVALAHLATPYPFAQWGIDILGPFPPAAGQVKYIMAAIDYFTKWVEAEAVASITSRRVKQFLWKNVVCRFGVPRVLILDNGTQFSDRSVREWCQELGIRQQFTSIAHPQANGQIELTNRTLLRGLKARVDKAKGSWVEELSSILWSYRTTVKVSIGETPFSLCYGSEALIPVEIGVPTLRVELFDPESNEQSLRDNLHLLDEFRDQARIRQAAYNQLIERYYNR